MLHIMVVDDEAPIRDWLVYCIQKCEAASSVTSAVNGEEAYRRILEQKPNVVFTDIRMPGMDGLELMSKVRDILPFTVFIILTNYAEFSYAKQAQVGDALLRHSAHRSGDCGHHGEDPLGKGA